MNRNALLQNLRVREFGDLKIRRFKNFKSPESGLKIGNISIFRNFESLNLRNPEIWKLKNSRIWKLTNSRDMEICRFANWRVENWKSRHS